MSVGIKLIQTAFKRCQRRAQFHRCDRHIIPAAPPANWLSFNIISPLSRRGHGRSELFLGSPVHEKSQSPFASPVRFPADWMMSRRVGGGRVVVLEGDGECGWIGLHFLRSGCGGRARRRLQFSASQPAYITFITRLKPKWVSGFVNKLFVLAEAASAPLLARCRPLTLSLRWGLLVEANSNSKWNPSRVSLLCLLFEPLAPSYASSLALLARH